MKIIKVAVLFLGFLIGQVCYAGYPDDWFIKGAQAWLQSISINTQLENEYRRTPDLVSERLDTKAFAFASFSNGYVLGMLKQAGFPDHFPCKKKFEHTTEVITNLALWIRRNPAKASNLWNGQIVRTMLNEVYLCK